MMLNIQIIGAQGKGSFELARLASQSLTCMLAATIQNADGSPESDALMKAINYSPGKLIFSVEIQADEQPQADDEQPERTIDLETKLRETNDAIKELCVASLGVPNEAYELQEILSRAIWAEKRIASQNAE